MRGSPLISLTFVGAALCLAWFPLQRLVGDSGSHRIISIASATGPRMTALPVVVRLTFSERPRRFVLRSAGGGELARIERPDALDIEREIELVIPPEGIEFFLDGEWPPGTERAAVRVEVAPQAMEERSATAWSRGPALSEILEFAWEQ